MPKISVIMGIYNCADTLPAAIESVMNQTVKDWELIMCDDGSSDDTYVVANRYKTIFPEKIKLLRNERNQGLNSTLNRCLREAQGSYIARMDGDDICEPSRFALELQVLETEKNISIVSSDMSFFDESGRWGVIQHPDYPSTEDFISESPFCHASCMVRREAYEAVSGYSEEKRFLRVEDYHLWIKMYSMGYQGKNIHFDLYHMRDDRNAYSRRKFRYRLNEAYVKVLAIKTFNLPIWYYILALRPIIVGVMPGTLYNYLHKRRLKD